ncbi:AraC family transcriptional regulator [Agriterribacter sp.]|uniref:helix-turn-helix domain-containing protein n=1 Tax=Agriterribacter sp. TaxID=2821509 RepID=UPI002BE63A19|nr:AraC family transcriptional regulator [Agriterribacter sp.]HRP55950.1 AraC family transcriptional regulator [Agriterribacter sp.]
MSFYKAYQPSPVLKGIVRELQVYHAQWSEAAKLPEPFITCLANTEQNLYFYLHDPVKIVPAAQVEIPVPRVVVTGPKYKPVGLLFGKDHLMVKVAFYPTGTWRLLGIPMQQTVNNGIDAATIWGSELNNLLEQLTSVSSYDAMVEIVISFLEKKFDASCRPQEPVDQVAVEMLDPMKAHSLKTWAHLARLSLRQFERSFITRVGIAPKLFIRIVRFEYAMKIKNAYPGKNWSQIALECGYTDSSHLLKEFKAFAEFPPGRFYLQPTSGHSAFPTG